MLYIKAPAKINLTLDVLYKRPDNYHEIEMIMTTVDLADRIGLQGTAKGIHIQSADRFVPNDSRNLAYQAAQLIKDTFNIKTGVIISLEKQIPVAAGLAGGSSDAAATLKGLNQLWQLNLSLDELAELGAKIGSDVSFCVYGGTALATGRGEVIEELPAPPHCWVILAKPSLGVSTADVYGAFDPDKADHPDTQAMIAALREGDYEAMCDNLGNALESVTMNLHPEVGQIKEHMIKFGADAVLMSGSGPTVFGLVNQEARIPRIYNGLRGFCSEVYAVRLLGDREPLA
ncbi:4-(cytidine 5'-diphospho)-2-C-methyl-D-erythritol kinase [Planococcus maritimus]|nr:4-(cytidine 5'-diphospho)-2-C-methyl-D-erythritol kinase [Planococcus sp. SK3692]MDE4085171.1 4-(cytidine 5'-diphospho)-2-C-methyl-D-erythritol kinase [Planococcus maritimus]